MKGYVFEMVFRRPSVLCLIPAVLLVLSLLLATLSAETGLPPKRVPTLRRLEPERLAAAAADVEKLRTLRRDPTVRAKDFGYEDFRAILHAHAEDSSHTGGTRPEMLRDAKRAGVRVIFLSDHFRPPRDFMKSWRGLRDGVLFIPGSETHGLIVHPDDSVMDAMKMKRGELARVVGRGTGLSFLSHVEKRQKASLEGIHGLEIYNRHADAESDKAALLLLASRMCDPDKGAELQKLLQRYPDPVFATQVAYPALNLAKWDEEAKRRRVVGIAANDCHHNQVFVVNKRDESSVLIGTNVDAEDEMRIVTSTIAPGVRKLVAGKQAGEELARFDFDPYAVSFRNVSTHIFAKELTEASIRQALREGRAYVSHDWMADPTGFLVWTERGEERIGVLGEEFRFQPKDVLRVESPVPATLRVIADGVEIARTSARSLSHVIAKPAAYRIEAWLSVGGELRPWIYANPVYARP